jgi:hypothetical protein
MKPPFSEITLLAGFVVLYFGLVIGAATYLG